MLKRKTYVIFLLREMVLQSAQIYCFLLFKFENIDLIDITSLKKKNMAY